MARFETRLRWWAPVVLAVFILATFSSPVEARSIRVPPQVKQNVKQVLETGWVLARRFGKKVFDYTAGYLFGEVIDELRDDEQEIVAQVERAVRVMPTTGGDERQALRTLVDHLQQQIVLLREARKANASEMREIQARQKDLLAAIGDLDERLAAVEAQLTTIATEVTALHRAQIRDCLDLVDAYRLGLDGYPVSDRPGNLREGEGRVVGVDAWATLYLDSCSPDLIERGLLIQSALVAHDVEGELSMWVTVSSPESGASQRFEYFLGTPLAPVDGQVREFFLPYAELPVSPTAGRTAVAVVLTLGGKVVYQLPPRAFSCSPGAQIDCVWR